MSVISIEPGLCVMQIDGRAASIATWGVTPQAQNTGQLIGRHLGRIAPVGAHDVLDADRLWNSQMYRRAMHGGEARCDLNGANCVGRRKRTHRHHHLALEAAGGNAIDVGAVHGNRGVALDVLQGDALLQYRQLEGERAAEHEGDEIVRPVFADVGGLVDQFAVLEHAIARHVGSNVDVAEIRKRRVPRRAHADHRAWLGIALAERGELLRRLQG